MSSRFYPALILLGGLHLLLVILGASYTDLSAFGPVGEVINYYGEMSGSNKSYGFFAPGVGAQARTRFEMIDASGKSTLVSLENSRSHEADLRINNITSQMTPDSDEVDVEEVARDLRRSVAASLAGKVFGRFRTARSVIVHVDEFNPVNMPEYRLGQRPKWEEIYQATFVQDTTVSEVPQ